MLCRHIRVDSMLLVHFTDLVSYQGIGKHPLTGLLCLLTECLTHRTANFDSTPGVDDSGKHD